MTVRKFMLKKFPTNEWMDCPVPQHHWETIQEYADAYHESKVKNILLNPVVMPSLPDGLVEGSNCDDNYKKGWIDCWNKVKGNEA